MTGLAGVGTRLYDSPARAELYGYRLRTTKPNCRSSSSAVFRAHLTDERDRPLCSNETSDLRQNWTVWPSDFSPSYHVWAAELGTTRVFTHACMASRTRIVAAVPKYGEHAWDYVIISWRHNLGANFLYFMFAIKEIFNISWTFKIVSFPKFVMQFNYG